MVASTVLCLSACQCVLFIFMLAKQLTKEGLLSNPSKRSFPVCLYGFKNLLALNLHIKGQEQMSVCPLSLLSKVFLHLTLQQSANQSFVLSY